MNITDYLSCDYKPIDSQETIVEWWDDAVSEAIEDGFLDPRNYHQSAWDYAVYIGAV